MPNIVEYNAPANEKLQPSDIGETSAVRAANKLATFGEEAGRSVRQGVAELTQSYDIYQKHMEQQDVSQGLAAFATGINQDHDATLETMKTPGFSNDPDAMSKLDQSFHDRMDGIRNSIKTDVGRRTFDEHVNEYSVRRHDQNYRDLSAVAASNTDDAVHQYVTQLTGLAEKNPATMEGSIKQLQDGVKSILANSPNVSPEDQAKLQTRITSAAKAQIYEAGIGKLAITNPGAVSGILASLPADSGVDGNKMLQMAKAAQAQARANAVMGRQEAALARADNQRKALEGVAGQLRDAVVAGKPPPADLGTHILDQIAKGNIDFHAGIAAYDVARSRLMQPDAQIQSDQVLKHEFYDRAALPVGDPNRLTVTELNKAEADAMNGRPGLSKEDSTAIYQLQERGDRDPALRSALSDFSRISKSFNDIFSPKSLTGQVIPGQAALVAQYTLEKRDQFLKMFQAGVPIYEMMNDPSSKNYLWGDAATKLNMDPQTAQKLIFKMMQGGVDATVPSLPGTPPPLTEKDPYNGITDPVVRQLIDANRSRQQGK